MTVLHQVPVIDMSEANGGRNPAFIDALGKACEGIGFATLVGHGLNRRVVSRMYRAARNLFQLPVDVLQECETPENGRQTGYTSRFVEGAKDSKLAADNKHFFHVRRVLPPGHPERLAPGFVMNQWPVEAPGFKRAALNFFAALEQIGQVPLTALNAYLGLAEGTLPGMVVDGSTLLRVLHYPAVDSEVDRANRLRADAHHDINLLTLLVAATASGLEVQTRDGDWIAVNESPGSIVLNIGDMLQMYTAGRMISTCHRVVNPSDGDLSERYSLPVFMHPRPAVVLDQATGFTAYQYLQQRLEEIGLKKKG